MLVRGQVLQAELPSRSAVLLLCERLWGAGEVPFRPPASSTGADGAAAPGAGPPAPGSEVSAPGVAEAVVLPPAQRGEQSPIVGNIHHRVAAHTTGTGMGEQHVDWDEDAGSLRRHTNPLHCVQHASGSANLHCQLAL